MAGFKGRGTGKVKGYYLVIAAESVCAVFMFIVLMGLFSVTRISKNKALQFRRAVGATLMALVIDSLSYIIESGNFPDAMKFSAGVLSFLIADFVLYFICKYVYAELQEKRKFNFDHAKAILGFCLGDTIFILVATLSGKFMSITDGVVTYGQIINYTSVLPSFCEIYIIILILHNRKVTGTRSAIIYSLYLLIPAFSVFVLAVVYPAYSLLYIACSFSVILIYVMILSGEIMEFRTKDQLITEISILDSMTGLKNRNAFEGALPALKEEEKLGFVYCDVNALKRINDSQGVEKGNKRILLLADLLKRSFEVGSVYRIGGDDFFVVVKKAKRVEFEGLVNTFIRKVSVHDSFAAVGYAYGAGADIFKLISEAENILSVDKLGYYQSNNIRRV